MRDRWVADLPGLSFLEDQIHTDVRGSFTKFVELDSSPLVDPLKNFAIAKNPTIGTLRGLHFQNAPYAEEKAIMCTRGSIFEAFVDLRRSTHTYGSWTSRVLSEADSCTAFVPKGIAHGYQTLEENSWVLYGLTAAFSPKHAQRITYDDKTLAINWPLAVTLISTADVDGLTWLEFEAQKFQFEN
jgi:dTDP-4-dehydrorhamnose 3,5-epimerase